MVHYRKCFADHKTLSMAKVKALEGKNPDFVFQCPGCNCNHGIWTTNRNDNKAIWSFNNNLNSPTVQPSILVRYNNGGEDMVCHSFITDGNIMFLGDCTHNLKGQTVALPEID
jgi:hypothetical protein